MNIFLFGVFKALVFLIVIFGILLGYYFLARPTYLLERVFPKDKPKAEIFFSKKAEDSDRFVLYYFARVFLFCVVALVVVGMLRFIFN